MKTESGSFSEGRATSLKNIGGMEEIRDARGIRDMMMAGVIAAAALIPVLLWAPWAHAHPGHGASGVTATLVHYFLEPVHGLFAVPAAGLLIGLKGLVVARSRVRRTDP